MSGLNHNPLSISAISTVETRLGQSLQVEFGVSEPRIDFKIQNSVCRSAYCTNKLNTILVRLNNVVIHLFYTQYYYNILN